MKWVCLILFSTVLVSFPCFGQQQLGFSLSPPKKKVEIPIEIYNNLVVVPVILNDALPLKFILDTGVRTAILTQKTFSDILNLTYNRKYTIAGPGGEKLIDAYVTNNVSLELPGIRGEGHALLVLDQDYLELRNYLGTDVHGILGYELFSRFVVQIDYEKKLLTILAREKFRQKRKFEKVNIEVLDTKPYLTVPITFFGDTTTVRLKLLVDSGASHGLLIDPSTDDRIHVPENTVSSVIGRGLGGPIVGKVGRIKRIQFGSYKMEDVIVNFPDPNSYYDSLKQSRMSRNGAIGGEILSRFKVVFDFPGEKLYLKKNSSFNKAFHYNLSGIVVKAKGSQLNVFEITDIREKSVSDKAGLHPGDLIVSINGMSTDEMDLNVVNAYFNGKPGKRIRVELNRNGEIFKKEFYLEDQI